MNDKDHPKKIAIVKLSAIGDIIHAIPVANTITKHFPNCHVTWITEKPGADLLVNLPGINRVIVMDTKSWRKLAIQPRNMLNLASNIFSTLRELRNETFDAAVDLQGLIKSGVCMGLLPSREKWGFPPYRCREKPSALFTNHKISDSLLHGHVIQQNLAFAYLLGCKNPVLNTTFPCSDQDKQYINSFLKLLPRKKNMAVINPGTGWITKNWPWKNYVHICRYLFQKHNIAPIITWGPGEKTLAQNIHKTDKNVSILAPSTSLKQLAYLLRKVQLVIGGDTGPIHMAATQGIPVVAIMGPSDPQRNGPYATKHVVISNMLDCSGCYKRTCENPVCMLSITVDQVKQGIDKLLDSITG